MSPQKEKYFVGVADTVMYSTPKKAGEHKKRKSVKAMVSRCSIFDPDLLRMLARQNSGAGGRKVSWFLLSMYMA